MTHIKSALKCQVIILLLACLHLNGAIAVNSNETNVEKIQWENLTPLNWNPTQILDNMTDEQYYALSDDELLRLEETVQALFNAAPVNDDLNGKRVKIPGFVLPLEFNNTLLSEFLLVPYFGACTHTPPPPANQIILVIPPASGLKVKSMDPVWVEGILTESRLNNDMGVSAYQLNAAKIAPYK